MADKGFKRKLAAIISADVEGYSRLMDDDEEATVRTLTSYRSTISDLVQQFRGRIVDTPGDNILAEFISVVDSVNCAVEIQRELAERNAELPDRRRMEFRIGVNLGDVIEEEGRIYGDGVNIAARVETMAEAGGICLSGRAYDHVENKLELEYEYLGEQKVKNITRPIRVYRVLSYPGAAAHRVVQAKKSMRKKWLWVAVSTVLILLIGIIGLYWKYFYLPAPTDIDPENKMTFELPKGPSIAVLPFDNMTGDPDLEFFCDGITENIISTLSQLPDLLVIGRHSTFSYKNKPVKIQQIGKELGADYVLEGSIQKSNKRIRITVQLINSKSGHHEWAETFDRELNDFFKLQDEIAIQIMGALIKLFKGIDYLRAADKESNSLAITTADEIIELDPELSAGHSLLSAAYLFRLQLAACDSVLFCIGRAAEATKQALALDEFNSDAHLSASYLFTVKGELQKAIAEAKIAISLNPNGADAYDVLGYALIYDHKPAEAMEYINKAIRLNPIPPVYYLHHLAWTYRDLSRYDEAIDIYLKCIKLQPKLIWPYIHLAYIYSVLGNQEKSEFYASEVLRLDPDYSLKGYHKRLPYRNKAKVDQFVEVLRKAGLPD
jgi:TolB-like protein/class 3 adenylate cyclase/Flp pilus assembly protein TadD